MEYISPFAEHNFQKAQRTLNKMVHMETNHTSGLVFHAFSSGLVCSTVSVKLKQPSDWLKSKASTSIVFEAEACNKTLVLCETA